LFRNRKTKFQLLMSFLKTVIYDKTLSDYAATPTYTIIVSN